MRLRKDQVANIIQGLEQFSMAPVSYELYLFGSRVDDHKKGGDIDLLLILNRNDFDSLAAQKHKLLVAVKKYVDDEKIDLTLKCNDSAEKDPFYLTIKDSLILLKKR